MGRRKIEIQPITHERNRSVTFLKRKNGLFKKAYELGVLCSVDVAVIIFEERPGHHHKLYQYCSADIHDIVARHVQYDGERDSRGPADFSGVAKTEDAGEADDDDQEEEEVAPPPPRAPVKRTKPKMSPDIDLDYHRVMAIPSPPMTIRGLPPSSNAIPTSSDRHSAGNGMHPPSKKPRLARSSDEDITLPPPSSGGYNFPPPQHFRGGGGSSGAYGAPTPPFFPPSNPSPSFLTGVFDAPSFRSGARDSPAGQYDAGMYQQLLRTQQRVAGHAAGPSPFSVDWPVHGQPPPPQAQGHGGGDTNWLDFLSSGSNSGGGGGGGGGGSAGGTSWERGGGGGGRGRVGGGGGKRASGSRSHPSSSTGSGSPRPESGGGGRKRDKDERDADG